VKQITLAEEFFSTVAEPIRPVRVTVTQVEAYRMFQFQPISQSPRRWRSGTGDASWLSRLVARFEKISQADVRAVPCDEPVLLALKAHLARPASLRGGRGSDSRLL
jgi:hypothetical protein